MCTNVYVPYLKVYNLLREQVDPFYPAASWVHQNLSQLCPQKVKLPVCSSTFLNFPTKEVSRAG